MKPQALVFSLAVALTPLSTLADVYKCVVNGQTVYSDKKCATEEESEAGRMDNKPALSIGAQKNSSYSSSGNFSGNGKGRERKKLAQEISEQLKESCLDKWRSILKDPKSPYIVSAQIDEVRNLERSDIPAWKEVVMDVRAKNSFGGYIPGIFVCGIGENGLADETITEGSKALYKLDIKLLRGDRYVE